MMPGDIIRGRRRANGLTQQQLALRSGSTQAAISRLERGELSPTFETFARLLSVMGEEADVEIRRPSPGYDRSRLGALRARSPAERLELAIGWNRLAAEMPQAGAAARAGEPMTGREIPLDARQILRVLDKHQVEYVVIGGLAVQAHGHTRTTQDVDFVPEPGPANLDRLKAALAELRARPLGAAAPTAGPPRIPAEGVLELDTYGGGVDVDMHPAGAAPYAELRSRSLKLDLGDLQVLVAGRDDLIAMKRASGRPIDRGDILALTEPVRGGDS